jgi:crotonobetainyl-CoA:carnitine CoA-transferase CaiB-like acyl-CoA transferase
MLLADMGADVVRVERLTVGDRGIDFLPQFDLEWKSNFHLETDFFVMPNPLNSNQYLSFFAKAV